ncbi:MAG: hypothetical protein HUK22_06655, partial [Thermoguttaceae bacterium]|nr:hypothetical protein [Thermoguttaceae bacterium]
AFGLWAWNPETFDFERARRSIYRYVYGEPLVETLCEFDQKFGELKDLYRTPTGWHYNPATEWPRLKDEATRDDVLRRLDELDALCEKIMQNAQKESALEPERIEYAVLEPMRASLEYARKFATFDYLDYHFNDLQARIQELALAKDEVALTELLGDSRQKIVDNLARFQETFSELKGCESYVARWDAVAKDGAADTIAKAYQKVEANFAKFSKYVAAEFMPYLQNGQDEAFASLFGDLAKKPNGTVLKRIDPSAWANAALSFRGNLASGLWEHDGKLFYAIGLAQNTPAASGDYCAARITAVVPEWKGKLFLNFFASDTRITEKDYGYRMSKLSVNGKVVWEEDVAADQRGRSLRQVEIGDLVSPGDAISIEFCVEETKPVSHHASVTFLGPIEFCEVN